MRITIAAIGRARDRPEARLYDAYAARLPWSLTLREAEAKARLSGPARQRAEAELLLAAVPQGAVIVALDETGRGLDSRGFAGRLQTWREEGRAEIAFLIGGADGLEERVRKRADLVLSLGAPTWPHLLVRALLAEQLYRAHTILTGHPYHRD